MAADVLETDSSNPCCAKLKQKFLKLKEDRNFLRNGMKIVGERVDKLVRENLQLQKEKAYAEQQLCEKQEKEDKIKEPDIKKKLEKEIDDLKEKISSYQRSERLTNVNDDENKLLKARVSEGQDEIRRLKELFEKERKKSESEKKKAELEKKKADEAWKLVKEESDDLKEKISSYQRSEHLININDDDIKLLNARVSEGQDEIRRLKELLEKEKKKSESEKKKAELEKKKAGEAWKLVKEEKVKAEEERKLTEVVRKKSEEYRMSWEKAKSEAKGFKAELSKANDARKRVEEEKQKISIEKAHADSQTKKLMEAERKKAIGEKARADYLSQMLDEEKRRGEELRKKLEDVESTSKGIEKARADSQTKKLMEAERKKAIGEKARADYLSQMLDEEKHRGEELQKKLEDVESTSKGRYDSCNGEKMHSSYVGIMNANMKLLRGQLKLGKKQAKYAKKIAKLEQTEKSFIMQEHRLLKHNFMQMLSRFNMLDARLSHSIEYTDAVAKFDKPGETHDFKMENNQLGSKRVDHCSRIDCGLRKTCCTCSFNLTEPTRDLAGFPLLKSCCTGPITGTISELESPLGGSDRNKSQSSAICSHTSYSDKRSMGSQERGSIAITASAKLTEKHPNKRPTVMNLLSEVAKTNNSKEVTVMTNKADKTYGCIEVGNACLTGSVNDANEVVDADFNRSSKRRKVGDTMVPIATMRAESKQSDFAIGERLAAPEDNLNIKCQVSAHKCFQGCGTSPNCFHGNDHSSEDDNRSARHNCNCSSTIMISKHQTPVLEVLAQNIDKTQSKKSNSLKNRDPRFTAVTTPPFHEVRGNIRVPPDLISFESMIRGNCLKLLDLDNVAAEERYRMAVEIPLSPTLPDFELPNNQLHVEDGTQRLMERENSVPLHPVDVMAMEINASTASGNLLPHDSQDSLYPSKDSGYNRMIKHQDCAGQHGRLNDVEDNPSFSDNRRSLNVEQMCPDAKSGDRRIDTVMVPRVGGHNALANPNACSHLVSGIINKSLLSDMAGFCTLQDDGWPPGSAEKMDNFIGCTSSVANIQDKSQRHADGTTVNLVENPTEAKDVASDHTIIFSTKSQVLNEIRELTKEKNIRQLSEASKQTTLFTSCIAEDTLRMNPVVEVRKTPLWCIAFSDIKDTGGISRVFRMRDAFSHQDLIDSQIDHVVKQVHNALAMNTALLPQEKCIISFSLLLCNVSSKLSANFKYCTKSEDLLPCSESFAADIIKVLSYTETKSLLAEICQLDILADIIKDFLIERKVLVYIERDYECNDLSSCLFRLDGAYVLSRAATIDQFVAGCIVLASISAAADRIDFLLEASYEIIRMSTSNVSWILFALHIFATVCKKEFFNANEYGFLIITLRSLVLLLEGRHQSVSSISPCFNSALDTVPTFSPCSECPFATAAICMDKLTNLLLDVLQCYTGSPKVDHLDNASVCMIPACSEKDEDSRGGKNELDGQSNASDASRYIIMFNKHAADLPDNFPARSFCHYTDIVSLMELIGLYMGWEWTKDNIIPRLSKMLEFCKVEEFSVALFVLVGQLGRFGIDGGSHEKKGISELRCTIAEFTDSSIARKMPLRTQFAAIGALHNLLPLNFRDIVGDHKDLMLDASQLGHAKLIKKWYLDLSKHQQSLCLNLFE